MRSVLFTVTAGLATLAAVPAQASEEWRQVAYTCESGQALEVAFRDNGRVAEVVAGDEQAVRLIARPAREGFRFSDSRFELRGAAESEITWRVGSRRPVRCTAEGPAQLAERSR